MVLLMCQHLIWVFHFLLIPGTDTAIKGVGTPKCELQLVAIIWCNFSVNIFTFRIPITLVQKESKKVKPGAIPNGSCGDPGALSCTQSRCFVHAHHVGTALGTQDATMIRTGMSPAHGAHKGTFGTVWSSLKVKGSTPLTNHLPVLS